MIAGKQTKDGRVPSEQRMEKVRKNQYVSPSHVLKPSSGLKCQWVQRKKTPWPLEHKDTAQPLSLSREVQELITPPASEPAGQE